MRYLPVICIFVGLLYFGMAQPLTLYAGGCFGRLSDQEPCSPAAQQSLPQLTAPRFGGSAGSAARPLNVRVVNSKLTTLADQRGEWSGIVTGFGHAALFLQIVQQAKLLDETRIGEVELSGSPTPFKFRAMLPPGSSWEWRIVSRAP